MGKWVKTIEKTDELAVSDHELDPNMKEKELLFAPYIFIIDETISNRKKLATAIRERGGKVKVQFFFIHSFSKIDRKKKIRFCRT